MTVLSDIIEELKGTRKTILKSLYNKLKNAKQ